MGRMKGEPYKRCGCTEVVDGKRRQLGQVCSKLRRADGSWNPRHGSWTFAISVKGPGGKRKQKIMGGFESRTDALKAREGLRDRVRRGVTVDDVLVEVFLKGWLTSKTDLRPSTHRSYRLHIQKYWLLLLGHMRLSELRVAHIAEAMTEVGGSAANKQRVRGTLRSALSDAVREGLITVNPAALVKLASGKRPKALVWTDERVARWREAVTRLEANDDATGDKLAKLEAAAEPPSAVMVWTAAQLGTFLDASQEDEMYPLLHLIAFRGLRRAEACGVEWTELDLDAGQLTVSRAMVQVGWAVEEGAPKSDAGGRTIALDAGTVTVLRAHRRRQLAQRMEWGSAWTDSNKVFTKADGAPLHPASITDRFHELADAAGLPPIRLHDLRHGAASLMLAAGVEAKVVSETLGHSTVGLTLDTYTSVYPQVAVEAAERTASMVPRAATGTGVNTIPTHTEPAASPIRGSRRSKVGRVGFEPTTRRVMREAGSGVSGFYLRLRLHESGQQRQERRWCPQVRVTRRVTRRRLRGRCDQVFDGGCCPSTTAAANTSPSLRANVIRLSP